MLFMGFDNAALRDWKITVISAMKIVINPDNTKINIVIFV